MRVIVIPHLGCYPAELPIQDHPILTPSSDHAIIAIKAFGIKHQPCRDTHASWRVAEANSIPGIECIGIVASCPSEEFAVDKVTATMGGLGRSINGTYAEYTKISVSNITKIDDGKEEDEMTGVVRHSVQRAVSEP